MASKVNYEDNLFYLMTITRALKAGVQLDIDPDYYLDKIVEDILFIDRTLDRIHESLRLNAYLINRRELLRELMRAKRLFADFLDDALDGTPAFGEHLAPLRAKLVGVRDQHVRDISDIQRSMSVEPSGDDDQNIVSQDEYRFLLQNDDEQE